MTDKIKTESKPPYVAYRTFSNFITSLRSSGVPGRIDRSILDGMSGATQSFLMATLRFLGFVDPESAPTVEFQRLVKEPNSEKEILAKATKDSYHFIFNSINVESATEAQLLDKFKDAGLGGDTVRKCLSFFVHLCRAAGIKVSPHVKGGGNGGPKSGQARRPYRHRKPPDPPASQPGKPSDAKPEPPSLQEMLLKKFPDFDPNWNPETQKKWFDNFEQFMKSVKGNTQ